MQAPEPSELSGTASTAGTARTARHRYRDAEGSAARLRLLADTGLILATQGADVSAMRAILARARAFLSMDEGLLLFRHADGLHVHAAHGSVHPEGACLPATGALHAAMLDNALPEIALDVPSRLRIGRNNGCGVEVLLPMRFHGRCVGVLALINTRPAPRPNADDLEALQVLTTMLAAAHPSAAKPSAREPSGDAAAKLKQLTTRELQVFALMPRGLTNASMAAELGIAPGTVKVHIERILHKLDLRDRTQAAVAAYELGLVHRITPTGGALDGALEYAAKIAANGPLAVVASKNIVQHANGWSDEEAQAKQGDVLRP
ncbi:MAG: LuxR C-terminal-related transcriptional regulator, partial [Gammaproteobacteria bacterium]